MAEHKIRVGSRDSALAVAQSKLIIAEIRRAHPALTLELVTMKTTGDLILDRPLDQIGGKGLFTKELDRALLDGRIDLAVHSLKDMPMELSPLLPLVGYSRRADPRDVLVLPLGEAVWDRKKAVGCSGGRRSLLLKKLEPLVFTQSVRGNVQTRLCKLDRGDYGALVLARAGLLRLGLAARAGRIFSTDEMIPAAGQGILAVQGRAGENFSFLDCVDDMQARFAATAERAFVRRLDGGCSSPIAAHAVVAGGELRITGLYYSEASGAHAIDSISGSVDDAQKLGETLAESLRIRV